ncbi:MAG TPA: efflux RND transporter periplasmic adaptor subunit, partial [Pseudolabrys sp.]
MNKIRAALILTLGLAAVSVAGYGYSHRSAPGPSLNVAQASAAERTILYYRDPGGAPSWSATPKNDAQGRAFLPVYDDAEPSFNPPKIQAPPLTLLKSEPGERKILFYRNPMGLPDTSPVPKKDSMGMDYIAVYEGDEPSDGKTIKVSLDR